jgi:hypothetical protein
LHTGPRIIDLAPFDGSDRRAFIDGAGVIMLSRDKRYCTQENIDQVVALCGEMPLQSVWVNYLNQFAHLGFTEEHYCLMRAVGWVWRASNISEYRKMMKYRPSWDDWSPPPDFPSGAYDLSHPSFKNSEAALLFMERHFGRVSE